MSMASLTMILLIEQASGMFAWAQATGLLLSTVIERRQGRSDQRVVEIHLLPKGEKLLARVAAQHQHELQLLLSEFGEAQ